MRAKASTREIAGPRHRHAPIIVVQEDHLGVQVTQLALLLGKHPLHLDVRLRGSKLPGRQ
jgi:hypothetical protein